MWRQDARQSGREGRDIGNDEDAYEEDEKDRPYAANDGRHRFVETVGGEEEIHPDRRGEIAQLEIGEEDDAEVNRIDVVGDPQSDDEGSHHDDCRVDVQ